MQQCIHSTQELPTLHTLVLIKEHFWHDEVKGKCDLPRKVPGLLDCKYKCIQLYRYPSLPEIESSLRQRQEIKRSEIPNLLCNPNIHYRVHKSSPLELSVNQINPAHISRTYLLISILLLSFNLLLGLVRGGLVSLYFQTTILLEFIPSMPYPAC